MEELQNHSVDDDTKRSLEDALKNSNKLIQQEIYSMKLIAVANNYKKGDLPEEVQSVTLTADDAALTPEEQIKKGQLMVFDQSYHNSIGYLYRSHSFYYAVSARKMYKFLAPFYYFSDYFRFSAVHHEHDNLSCYHLVGCSSTKSIYSLH